MLELRFFPILPVVMGCVVTDKERGFLCPVGGLEMPRLGLSAAGTVA